MSSPRYGTGIVSVGNGGLSYTVRVVAACGEAPIALVVALHGYGSDDRWAAAAIRGLPERVAVVAPRGPVERPGGGWAWCSAEFSERGPWDDAREAEKSAQMLRRAVPLIARECGVGSDRVALFGHSQGGMLALLLGSSLESPPIAIATVGAKMPPAPLCDAVALAGTPVRVCHGSKDRTVPVAMHAALVERLDERRACAVGHTYAGGHGLTRACAEFVTSWLEERIKEAQ